MMLLDKDKIHINQLFDLYLKTYSTGISAQKIDRFKLSEQLILCYSEGFVFLNTDSDLLKAALMAFPLKFDPLFPQEIFSVEKLENTIYISELMVDENFRKQGLANELLKSFEEICSVDYNTIVIRVWKENLVALNLYLKMGYEIICSIEEPKITADEKTEFVMQKYYLCKTL